MLHLPRIIHISNRCESPSLCDLSLSDDTTNLHELLEKEKQELAEELIWLRQTSKATFQKYYDEVEYLQRQCAVHIEAEVQLNAQLTENRAKEEVWRLRCLAAEEEIQAMTCEYDKSHVDSLPRPRSAVCFEEVNEVCSLETSNDVQKLPGKKILHKFRDKIRSWSNGNLLLLEEDTKSSNILTADASTNINKVLNQSMSPLPTENLHDINSTDILEEDYFIERVDQIADETSKASRSCFFGNVRSQEDLSLTISSRDHVIVSLEQTIYHQLDDMQNVQAEMACLIEAHTTKEKILSSLHKRREEYLKQLIKSLREKLKANDMSTKEQNEALSACKLYIQELTGELEKLLSVIKRAEDGGFVVDCNLS